MKNELSRLLSTGLIQGKNSRAIAKDLKKYWYGPDPKTNGGARYCMERLMRTELARVQIEAQKQSFVRNGFAEYTFHTNHGCCPICAALDGKHFKVSKMMAGTNAPPMHPMCRCSVSAYEDSDEYEAWLDYLSKGGTTEQWNKIKYSETKSKKRLENSAKAGKIKLKIFRTTEDPMQEVTGAGLDSHPKEIAKIKKDLEAAGAEFEYRDNAICYQPSIIAGRAGKFIIDKKASYSAWMHEYTHFLDDKEDGYIGFRVFMDTEKCINREIKAYDVEIELAKQAGRTDIVERLEELKRKEVARYEYDANESE